LRPDDQRSLLGLGRVLKARNQIPEADSCFKRIISLDSTSPAAEVAERERSLLAKERFRSAAGGPVRLAAVRYLQGAIERFRTMSPDQVRTLGIEIAFLGRQGLDINDPTKKYTLKSIPGQFSGLHCLCLMYAAFQQFSPGADVGLDLSDEYKAAKELSGKIG
jgi:hypothetical protein